MRPSAIEGGSYLECSLPACLCCGVGAPSLRACGVAGRSRAEPAPDPSPKLQCNLAGLTAVGGMVLAGGGIIPGTTAEALAGAAVLTSAVNIGGGFTITQVRCAALSRAD